MQWQLSYFFFCNDVKFMREGPLKLQIVSIITCVHVLSLAMQLIEWFAMIQGKTSS